jgi:hypothetical protein
VCMCVSIKATVVVSSAVPYHKLGNDWLRDVRPTAGRHGAPITEVRVQARANTETERYMEVPTSWARQGSTDGQCQRTQLKGKNPTQRGYGRFTMMKRPTSVVLELWCFDMQENRIIRSQL